VELVAYLDGELDDTAARRIEQRLARDPVGRAKAAALKKTFDLLDFLPKPEPSATFATRTLDKLPAVKSGSQPVPIPSGTLPQVPSGGYASRSQGASSSLPVPLSDSSMSPTWSARRWILIGALAVLGCGAIGYLGAVALRPHLFPARETGPDDLPLSDHRLIENLPLYSAVDDYEFVQKIAEPELFGGDPGLARDAVKTSALGADADTPSRAAFEALARAFRSLPSGRQQAIRELDRKLHAAEPETRERLFRVLETFGIWLDRLPETERKGVLAAATPGLRLGVIRDIRERQWLEGLPTSQRSQLAGLTDAKKSERIQQWKEEENRQRNLWYFVRKNAEAITGVKAPWPFDTDEGRKQVLEFARAAFHLDESKRSRLTPFEMATYREERAAAERSGSWVWFGKTVYDLTRSRRYELLPESADQKLMVVDFDDLPPGLAKFAERPAVKRRLTPFSGRWPDFAHEMLIELRQFKPAGPVPTLGPARVADFKEPVRQFWQKELAPKLSAREKSTLKDLENRWPEYPREFIRLARERDLSVPGVMLPGSPRRWDATYGDPFRLNRP
jgi:hypothetical protein